MRPLPVTSSGPESVVIPSFRTMLTQPIYQRQGSIKEILKTLQAALANELHQALQIRGPGLVLYCTLVGFEEHPALLKLIMKKHLNLS